MNCLSVIIVYTKKINERRVIMNIIPGKVTTFPTRTQLYEKGDNVETICYIKSGSITLENNGSSSTAAAGQFIGINDIYSGFYSCDYIAEAGTEILPIIADSPSAFTDFLSANPALQGQLVVPLCSAIVKLHDIYCTLYEDVKNFYISIESSYERYVQCCNDFSVSVQDFMMPHAASLYDFNEQSFVKNYNIIASLIGHNSKIEGVYNANGIKFLKVQLAIISGIFTTYDDMVFYLRSMVSLFASKSEQCLFAYAANLCAQTKQNDQVMLLLEDMKAAITDFDKTIQAHSSINLEVDYNRVDFYFMIANPNSTKADDDDDMYANAFDDDGDDEDDDIFNLDFDYTGIDLSEEDTDDDYDYSDEDSPNFSNTLKQLCDFAEFSNRYEEFNTYIEKFMALEDKESRDDSVRVFRKSFTVAFYELYEEVFIHYAKKGEKHRLVELFLNYGLLDERLLTDAQLEFLGSIPPIVRTEPCKVYRMKDWLMRVYKGEEIPSKNEFDMEYVDYVRDRKKNEGLTADQERKLLTDNEVKVRFEIQNMLKYNCRLINGSLLSFFPMLHMGNFEGEMENMLLTSDKINKQISDLLQVDYSIFYREMLYENKEERIDKETIQKEIFPNIILFPVAGINGIMWQEISGKRSNSEGRIFLPALFTGKLEDVFITIFGRFHWELCKTLQGTAWNNILVPSLTSEYADYIQFYRKNKELSADKKELLKNQFTRCRNNMREIFVYDYTIWMKFESAGAIRLNKVARRMLATYCPFKKDIRQKISSQPIFEEAMSKFERERQKKCKEIMLRFKALENKGGTIVEELATTQRFYEEL